MQTNRIIGTVFYAFVVSACNDVSQTGNPAADARNAASMASRQETQDALPQAVPVPPASASPVITGAVEASAASAETPVAPAKPDASTPGAAVPDNTAASSEGSVGSSTAAAGTAESKGGTDSPATEPLGTLSPAEQSKSMPMAGHGNNHSSPSLEQGAKK